MENNLDFGQVMISGDVIASIVAIAVEEVKGFKIVKTLVDKVSNKNQSIKVTFNEDEKLSISVNVTAEYGIKLKEEIPKVQDNIITNIEIMTGLKVEEVNVNVNSLYFTEKQ